MKKGKGAIMFFLLFIVVGTVGFVSGETYSRTFLADYSGNGFSRSFLGDNDCGGSREEVYLLNVDNTKDEFCFRIFENRYVGTYREDLDTFETVVEATESKGTSLDKEIRYYEDGDWKSVCSDSIDNTPYVTSLTCNYEFCDITCRRERPGNYLFYYEDGNDVVEYRADLITGTKVCEEQSGGAYPILEYWDLYSWTDSSGESYCGGSTDVVKYWDIESDSWMTQSVCGIEGDDTTRRWAEIREIFCREKVGGEPTPLDNELDIMTYDTRDYDTKDYYYDLRQGEHHCSCKSNGEYPYVLFMSFQVARTSAELVDSKAYLYSSTCERTGSGGSAIHFNTEYLDSIYLGGQTIPLSGRTHVCAKCVPRTQEEVCLSQCGMVTDCPGVNEYDCGACFAGESCVDNVCVDECADLIECTSDEDCEGDTENPYCLLGRTECGDDPIPKITQECSPIQCNEMDGCLDFNYDCVGGVCVLPSNSWTDMNGESVLLAQKNDYVRINSNVVPPYTITHFTGDIEVSKRYWMAFFDGSGFGFTSSSGSSDELLDVSDVPDDDEMNITILKPKCGVDFDLDDNLNISFVINDSDDYVFGNVSIDGVKFFSFNNSERNYFVNISQFERTGNIPIVIIMENSRGKEFRYVSNIMVYDSTSSADQYYVAACIDKPDNYYVADNSSIQFEATSSRAIKFSDGMTEPLEIDDNDLIFTWNFWYYGRTEPDVCSALGSQDCDLKDDSGWTVKKFTRNFPTVNDNQATLSVSIPADAM
jgi:hypothetical protein